MYGESVGTDRYVAISSNGQTGVDLRGEEINTPLHQDEVLDDPHFDCIVEAGRGLSNTVGSRKG